MKILFDENVPRPLRRLLAGHEVKTTQEMGWKQIENGELLSLAEQTGFDVLLTTDKNIPYQQRMEGRQICLIVLRAKNNRVDTLSILIPDVEEVLKALEPGRVYSVQSRIV